MDENMFKPYYEASIDLEPKDGLYFWEVYRAIGNGERLIVDRGACSSLKKCIMDAQSCKESHEQLLKGVEKK